MEPTRGERGKERRGGSRKKRRNDRGTRRAREKKRGRWNENDTRVEEEGERALVYSPRMAERQTGKRKRMGSEGGEVKLDTKSSKKN